MATRAADNILSTDEYGIGNTQSYAGNGATGFGGTVGNSTLYMATSATNLQIGWQPGGNLDGNLFAIYFNVNGGGTITTDLGNDVSDGGRRMATNPYGAGSLNYPITVQYSLVFGNFGAVLFQLTNSGSINFVAPFFGGAGGSGNNFREVSIAWSAIGGGLGSYIDYFTLYTNGNSFLSNEGHPSPFFSGNPSGESTPPATLTLNDYNRFIPTPGAMALLGLGGLVAGRRRRA
ncbi:MAG: hypothetical protein K2X32_04865 [Phycisphaerales bacterium]|nr:hypothetical protein [Phycisphaerales bacterium]